ncbi:DNA polymerase III subunit gamma/tau [Ruminococcaceae bacterium OttesenSCG-928-I18]|nr:DNA polymerase III subunit gamma/tau [Ruminococcaceae bacterium OttesenSCG-928-I18]
MAVIYKALYRKWRPQTFSDVVGQEAITGALTNQVKAGRVGHAYLFTGTRGTGKTTCAKVLAKTVNCEAPTEEGPCGQCACCRGIEDGSILDVIEIDAASNNGVDDVRDLRDETVYRPGRCKYKVYIIDEVHMLSVQAFNALLKILEEPPSHVIFILATTEIHKVPATILSRCQRFDFTRIPADKIKARLLEVAGQEEIPLTQGAAGLISVLADGSMRDALSLLDTCASFGEEVDEERVRQMAGVTDKSYLFSLSEAAEQGDLPALLSLVATLRERSIDVKRLTEELIAHYRNFLLAAAAPEGGLLDFLPEDERTRYLRCVPAVEERRAIGALERLAAALDRMTRSQDPRVELELALFEIAGVGGQASVTPAADAKQAVQSASKNEAPLEKPAKAVPVASPKEPVAPARAALPREPLPQKQQNTPDKQPPDEIKPFEGWDAVIAETEKRDPMVYSYLKATKAYFDGKRVLIDGSGMFLEFMRSNKNVSGVIKDAIQAAGGKRFGIGPYKAETQRESPADTTRKTLKEWEEKGIPIEYENGGKPE